MPLGWEPMKGGTTDVQTKEDDKVRAFLEKSRKAP